MQFTNGATREPLFHESYESWTCIYTVSLSNDIHFTNCTTRKLLFHDPYESYRRSAVLLMISMSPLIHDLAVQPVNHCFTICTGRTSRTSRVKPFTGRIRSTVLDKDATKTVTWKPGGRERLYCFPLFAHGQLITTSVTSHSNRSKLSLAWLV